MENNLGNSLAFCEARGISRCFIVYARKFAGEEIMEVGFNPNSGYTYLAMENGITIASMLGRSITYFVYDDKGEKEVSYEWLEKQGKFNN
jgi:hypothetical protein